MRYIKYAVLAAIALALVSVSLANRQVVTLQLLPTDLGALLGANMTLSLPLFIVIFASIATGLLVGFIWEWIREMRQRVEASAQKREMERMRRDLKQLKSEQGDDKDEVLALLDEAT